jgi:hypothetical protein
MMHSFGAKHDPEASENSDCTPNDKVFNINVENKFKFKFKFKFVLVGKWKIFNVKVFQ